MNWMLIIFFLFTFAADALMYRYRILTHITPKWRVAFLWFVVASDLLPLLMGLCLLLLPDNTNAVMSISMWCFYIFLLTVLPRLVFYGGYLLHLKWMGALLATATLALLIWGATYGRTAIRVERITIHSTRVPKAFEGFRIVQFSDTHIGTLVHPAAELQRLVDTINSLHPDLVVFSGDLINVRHTELDTTAMRILGSIRARHGIVSSIGNHDVGYYIKDSIALPKEVNLSRLLTQQTAMGWHVLDNRSIYIRQDRDSISLSGLSFDTKLQDFRHSFRLPEMNISSIYQGFSDSLFNITVSHLPQLWPNITQLGFGDLTLSGHVHSMQMKLHLFGHKYSPAQILYDLWSGLYQDEGHYLYINDGIGYVAFPMRLGVRPEVTLFELQR